MFKSGVFSFSVFSDSDNIDVVIKKSLDTWDSLTRSDVGIQVQFLSQSNIDGSVSLIKIRHFLAMK